MSMIKRLLLCKEWDEHFDGVVQMALLMSVRPLLVELSPSKPIGGLNLLGLKIC